MSGTTGITGKQVKDESLTGDDILDGSVKHSELALDDGPNPHGTTKADVGLGNVDNTSDANKPVSVAQQAALDLKYEASNPNGYETPAQLNSRDTANRARANHTGTQPASTITGLAAVATSGDKADVGLGNVDNTSDADKPVSIAQQAALDLKADKSIQITGTDGLVGGGDLSANRQISLPNLLTAGSAGAANNSLSVTVDAKGRVTAFSAQLINIVSSQVSNFASTVRSTLLTGLSTATNSVITASDTVLSAFGKIQAQLNAMIFGRDNAHESKDAAETTTGGAFVTYFSLNFTVTEPTGTNKYRMNADFNWSHNSASNDIRVRMLLDGVQQGREVQVEPKDPGADQEIQNNLLRYANNLAQGAHTIELQYRPATASRVSRMNRADIEVWRTDT